MVEEVRKGVPLESVIPPPQEENSSIPVSSFLNYSQWRGKELFILSLVYQENNARYYLVLFRVLKCI